MRKRVREKRCANPKGPSLSKALKITDEAFKRMTDAELQNFIHECPGRIAELAREKNQARLYQYIKALELEGERVCGSTYVRSTTVEVSWDRQTTLEGVV